MMKYSKLCLAAMLVSAAWSERSLADGTLNTVLDSGSATVGLDIPITVNVTLDGTLGGSLKHSSAIFRIEFSEPGAVLDSVAWTNPYQAGSIFDSSTPKLSQLPLLITSDLLNGPGYPSGIADIEFSNVAATGWLDAGTVVQLVFHLPQSFASDTLKIRAVPDTFAFGFDELTVSSGAELVLAVVPNPASVIVLLAMVPFRRRHAW